ncbi:serine hydrolase domain-containing protein [Caulobacter sp. NIBR2454]|uniref:serine hydrolase domain-containing protein n=1 Tax=Caulobacter sp. NIBR2454 TaxID=3015996 RepID=UPI0022B671EC|nr:serine hydrolase domain-containing protein [Caulobacter sp. NIBR2454]
MILVLLALAAAPTAAFAETAPATIALNKGGLAIAEIDDGKTALRVSGDRDEEKGLPLQADTVMYAASLTKFTFAYMVMQLVDEGLVDLDTPIDRYMKKPLPEYEKYADLAGDERWRKLTFRILLSHTTGFANFRFVEPDEKLRFHWDPGTRYGYSGEGINLAQFVLEEGLGLDVGKEMQRRVFDRLGMTRTSTTWRADFAENVAQGYTTDGTMVPHRKRGSTRAAGSMDTTIEDYSRFVTGFMRGEGLSAKARAEMLKPQIAITSRSQFPTLSDDKAPADKAHLKLSAGLGVVVYDGPKGRIFLKGGHDDGTDNMLICDDAAKRCFLGLSNTNEAQAWYVRLANRYLGLKETQTPWWWEYSASSKGFGS